ncbi:MAG: hypothetical protein KC422_07520 [Trueperaceae bacterium]|nr:hypothetical protein [Trueperaceae bacterium]
MIVLLVIAAIGTVVLAFINGFGAWLVSRRKPWIAVLFLVAAALLAVAFGGLVGFFPYTRVLLGLGLSLAWIASFLNAHIVLGNVVWRFHVFRGVVAIIIYIFADLGLGKLF